MCRCPRVSFASTLVWMVAFILINTIYLSEVEEPGLERRFGEDYRGYRNNYHAGFPIGDLGTARENGPSLGGYIDAET